MNRVSSYHRSINDICFIKLPNSDVIKLYGSYDQPKASVIRAPFASPAVPCSSNRKLDSVQQGAHNLNNNSNKIQMHI